MGRNEFLSQPSQEAAGSGLSQQKPWLNEGAGAEYVPIYELEAGLRLRTCWSVRMLDQYTKGGTTNPERDIL